MVERDQIAGDERVLHALRELRLQAEESLARERGVSAPPRKLHDAAPASECGVSKGLSVVARATSRSWLEQFNRR